MQSPLLGMALRCQLVGAAATRGFVVNTAGAFIEVLSVISPEAIMPNGMSGRMTTRRAGGSKSMEYAILKIFTVADQKHWHLFCNDRLPKSDLPEQTVSISRLFSSILWLPK